MSPPGPSEIPEYPGIPGLDSDPDPGILEIKSRDFSGFGKAHKTMCS